jgi:hypothetical protein
MTGLILNVETIRTFSGFIGIGIGFYLFYRYLLPRLHPFSMIGALLRYAASFCLLMLGLSMVFLSPHMRWTLNLNDWVYNLALARVTDNPFSAHVFSYITIPLVYFAALWLTRNEFFSFAYAASTVFLHEFTWYVYTTAFIFRSGAADCGFFFCLQVQPTLISSTAFVVMICAFGAVLLHLYKFPWKWFMVPFAYTWLFDSVWFWVNDWHVTVSIFDVVGAAQYAATPFYYDLGANLFENVGWITLFPIMIVALWFAMKHWKIERLLGRELVELPRHGWFS